MPKNSLKLFGKLKKENKTGSDCYPSYDRHSGEVTIRNGRLELIVQTKSGLNPNRMRDVQTGRTYADSDYIWPEGKQPKVIGEPIIKNGKNGSCSVQFKAGLDSLEIYQSFVVPTEERDVLMETITIRNPGNQALDTSKFACGFAKRIYGQTGTFQDVSDSRFTEIPYRVRPETGELCDYSISDIQSKQMWYAVDREGWYKPGEQGVKRYTSVWGSEGWAWYSTNETFLIQKYNPDAMEWSLLEVVRQQDKKARVDAGRSMLLRFGGAGRWKLGDPEGAARLESGESFTFGITRFHLLEGNWKDAFYSFRRFTESKGHIPPKDFNAPVHWNELYDNPLWWPPVGDSLENREKYYRRADIKIEAEKAHEIGCECLYLDPGWDTAFGSCIWAADRLGEQQDFVRWIKGEYKLALALHTPLAVWSDPNAYPDNNWRRDKNGNKIGGLCSASASWVEEKARRLIKLCKNGAYFLMFDGNWFTGECWDTSHGHSLSPTRQEHLDATLRLCQLVHQECPHILIELHDSIIGPGVPRYVPTYLLHAKPGSFDELWGYEYMVYPLEDIMQRRSVSLYYVNLAYSIPIYLHIDLRKDNEQTMMFWWYASTCRHLGFGGKHADTRIWQAHKEAMKTYLRLKPFYTQGDFYGLDETIHVHTLRRENAAVINCFNFEEESVNKTFQFKFSAAGLSPGTSFDVRGADSWQQEGDDIKIQVDIPGRGTKLIEAISNL